MKSFFNLRRSNEGKSAPAKLVKESQKAKPAPVSLPPKQPDVTSSVDPQAKSARQRQRTVAPVVTSNTTSKPIPTEENIVSSTKKQRPPSRPPIPIMQPLPSQVQPSLQKPLESPFTSNGYSSSRQLAVSNKVPTQLDVSQYQPTFAPPEPLVQPQPTSASRQFESTTYDQARESSRSKPKESSRREREPSRHREVSDRDREKESRRKGTERDKDRDRDREQRRRERDLAKAYEKEERARQAALIEREARERIQKQAERDARELEERLREEKRRLLDMEDRRRAQEEDKRRTQEQEARRRAQEEEAQRAREKEERRRLQEEERRYQREQEERRRAQELQDERRRAQEEERRQAEIARRQAYEQEQRRRVQEEEARRAQEKEERRAEAERRRAQELEEQRQAQEQERRRAQELEERRRVQEAEERRQIEERRRVQELEERRKAQEAEERRLAQEQERRRAQEAEERRRAQELEERRRAQELEERRRAQELEERRRAQELEERRQLEERRRVQELEERRRAQELEERRQLEERRRAQELEERRRAQELEERRRAQELEAKRLAQEQERRRLQEQEEKRLAQEQERRRLQEEERRQAYEQERRRAQEDERRELERRRAQEQEEKRLEQERRQAHEQEQRRRAQEQEEARRAQEKEERRRAQEQEEARRALEREERRRTQEQEERRRLRDQETKEREEKELREKAARREQRERQYKKDRERDRERDRRDRDRDKHREYEKDRRERDARREYEDRVNTSLRDLSSQALYNGQSHAPLRPPLAVLRVEEGDSSDSSRRHRTAGAHRRIHTDEINTSTRYPDLQSSQPPPVHSTITSQQPAYDHSYGRMLNSTSHARSASLPQDVPTTSTRTAIPPTIDPPRYRAPPNPIDPIPYDLAQKSTQSSMTRSDNRPVFQTAAGSKFVESSHVPSPNDPDGAIKRAERTMSTIQPTPFSAAGLGAPEQRMSQLVSIRAGQGPPDPQASNLFPKLGSQQPSAPNDSLLPKHADSPGYPEPKSLGGTAMANTGTGPVLRSTSDRPPPSIPVPVSSSSTRQENPLSGSADSGYASGSKQPPLRSSPNKPPAVLSPSADVAQSNPKVSSGQRGESSRARADTAHSNRPSPVHQKKEIAPSPRASTQVQLDSGVPPSARPPPNSNAKQDSPIVSSAQPATSLPQRDQETRTKSSRPSPTITRQEVAQSNHSPIQERREAHHSSRPSPVDSKREIPPTTYSPAGIATEQKQEEVLKAQYSTRTAVTHGHDPPKMSSHLQKEEVHIPTSHSARPSPDHKLRELSTNAPADSSRNMDLRKLYKQSQPSPVAQAPVIASQTNNGPARSQPSDTPASRTVVDHHKLSDSENVKSGTAGGASHNTPPLRGHDISKSNMPNDASWGRDQAATLANLLSHTPKPSNALSSAAAYAARITQVSKNGIEKPSTLHVFPEEKRKDPPISRQTFWEPPKPFTGTSRPSAPPQAVEVNQTDVVDQRTRPSVQNSTGHTVASLSADERQRSTTLVQKPVNSTDRDAPHPTLRHASQLYNDHLSVPPQILSSFSQNSVTTSTRPNPPSPEHLYHLAHSDLPASSAPISSSYPASHIASVTTMPLNDGQSAPSHSHPEPQRSDDVPQKPLRNDPVVEAPARREPPAAPALFSPALAAQSRQMPSQLREQAQPPTVEEVARRGATEASRYAAEYMNATAQRDTPVNIPITQPTTINTLARPTDSRLNASVETLLATPSSLAPSMLKPTVSRTSAAPSTDSQHKRGILGTIFRKTRHVVPPANDQERRAPPQEEKAAEPTQVKPAPDQTKPTTAFTPFTHLMSRRHVSPSNASYIATDGTAAGNTTIGSPTVSMHSAYNPVFLPPPPQSDPVRDTKEWVHQEAATQMERRGPDGRPRPHKPGVVFNVSEDPDEERQRPKPMRRPTGHARKKKDRNHTPKGS